MDLLQGNVKTIYFKYLSAAFGSTLISSIYGIVDMAMVGQYQGPDGTAALAVVAPVWNILYSLGLLAGIGGSVLSSTARGRGEEREKNEYFTMALLCTLLFAGVCWLVLLFLEEPLLRLFGADAELLELAKAYLLPVKFAVPLFLFSQMLAAFLRNDGHPGLATAAVLSGGILNVLGDYLFVFAMDMGILGAGLATAVGALVSCLLMLTHFLTAGNTLRLALPKRPGEQVWQILVTGFSTFFIDVAMGILTMLFNRQIMKYLGTSQYQHDRAVLRLQRGSVGPAAFLPEFRRGKMGPHPADPSVCPVFHGVFQCGLDSSDAGRSQWLCPDFHGSHRGNLPHRALYYAQLWNLLSPPSAEYFFHLLFSGADEAHGGFCGLRNQGSGGQRRPDLYAACDAGAGFHLACHAAD